jgi:hypothetical protein
MTQDKEEVQRGCERLGTSVRSVTRPSRRPFARPQLVPPRRVYMSGWHTTRRSEGTTHRAPGMALANGHRRIHLGR